MLSRPLLALAACTLCANAPPAELELRIERLRSAKGVLHICLTRHEAHFPDCNSDPEAITKSLPAAAGSVRFPRLTPGAYAIAILLDENNNGKLDTLLGIPREGFGFSRNPVVRFGAPRFRQVIINLSSGFSRQTVRMQYLL